MVTTTMTWERRTYAYALVLLAVAAAAAAGQPEDIHGSNGHFPSSLETTTESSYSNERTTNEPSSADFSSGFKESINSEDITNFTERERSSVEFNTERIDAINFDRSLSNRQGKGLTWGEYISKSSENHQYVPKENLRSSRPSSSASLASVLKFATTAHNNQRKRSFSNDGNRGINRVWNNPDAFTAGTLKTNAHQSPQTVDTFITPPTLTPNDDMEVVNLLQDISDLIDILPNENSKNSESTNEVPAPSIPLKGISSVTETIPEVEYPIIFTSKPIFTQSRLQNYSDAVLSTLSSEQKWTTRRRSHKMPTTPRTALDDESLFMNSDYEYVDTSDPNFNATGNITPAPYNSTGQQKAEKRTLDLLYHMFVDPTTDKHGRRRNTLFEDVISAIDKHIVGDVVALKEHKKSGRPSVTHFAENNSDFFKTLLESIGLDNNFMLSTAQTFKSLGDNDAESTKGLATLLLPDPPRAPVEVPSRGRPQGAPVTSTNIDIRTNRQSADDNLELPQIEQLGTGNKFLLTNDDGSQQIISTNDIVNSLLSLSENEIMDLLVGENNRRVDNVDNDAQEEDRVEDRIEDSTPNLKINNLIVLGKDGRSETIPFEDILSSRQRVLSKSIDIADEMAAIRKGLKPVRDSGRTSSEYSLELPLGHPTTTPSPTFLAAQYLLDITSPSFDKLKQQFYSVPNSNNKAQHFDGEHHLPGSEENFDQVTENQVKKNTGQQPFGSKENRYEMSTESRKIIEDLFHDLQPHLSQPPNKQYSNDEFTSYLIEDSNSLLRHKQKIDKLQTELEGLQRMQEEQQQALDKELENQLMQIKYLQNKLRQTELLKQSIMGQSQEIFNQNTRLVSKENSKRDVKIERIPLQSIHSSTTPQRNEKSQIHYENNNKFSVNQDIPKPLPSSDIRHESFNVNEKQADTFQRLDSISFPVYNNGFRGHGQVPLKGNQDHNEGAHTQYQRRVSKESINLSPPHHYPRVNTPTQYMPVNPHEYGNQMKYHVNYPTRYGEEHNFRHFPAQPFNVIQPRQDDNTLLMVKPESNSNMNIPKPNPLRNEKQRTAFVSSMYDQVMKSLPKPIHYKKPATPAPESSAGQLFGFSLPNIFSSGKSNPSNERKADSESKEALKWDDPLGLLGIYDILPFSRSKSKSKNKATTPKPISPAEQLEEVLKVGNVPDSVSKILVSQMRDNHAPASVPRTDNRRMFAHWNPFQQSAISRQDGSPSVPQRYYQPPPLALHRRLYNPSVMYTPSQLQSQTLSRSFGPPKPGSIVGDGYVGAPESFSYAPATSSHFKEISSIVKGHHHSEEVAFQHHNYHAGPVSKEYDSYIVPVGFKNAAKKDQPLVDVSLLFNSVKVHKHGEENESIALPSVGDPAKFVDTGLYRPINYYDER